MHRRIHSRQAPLDNLRAAGWDLAVAALLIIVAASALLLVVLPPVIALLHG